MSELDVIKEQIAYFKLWLGIMVVTDISLFGWLITNFGEASTRITGACVFTIIAISGGILFTHRRIERYIETLRRF